MKNIKATYKITQGMYVLTTNGGGCIVDAVSQISSGNNPLISVSVMKKNYTNELLKKNDSFALSIIGMDTNKEIIEKFGMHSARDYDKFDGMETLNIDGEKIIKGALAYMVCKIVDKIENDTHTLFIGRLVEADVLNDGVPMSYAYYQENKEEFIKVKSENGLTAWVCTICGYVYYGESLPEGFKCPACGVDASLFQKR